MCFLVLFRGVASGDFCISLVCRPLYGIATCFGLFLVGQFDSMVYDNIALDWLSDVEIVLVVIVQGKGIDFVVRESITPAFLHIIEDKSDTVVDILLGIGISGAKQFILLRSLLQILLDGAFEIFGCFIL